MLASPVGHIHSALCDPADARIRAAHLKKNKTKEEKKKIQHSGTSREGTEPSLAAKAWKAGTNAYRAPANGFTPAWLQVEGEIDLFQCDCFHPTCYKLSVPQKKKRQKLQKKNNK